ncbi:hypothetical protein JCM6882_003066 [Rhodosporidiobolus microsporus]
MASSSPISTEFETVTLTSLVPTVTGTTTFVVVDPNIVFSSVLTQTIRGETVTSTYLVTGATVTTTSLLTGTETSLIVTSTPVSTEFSTVSSSTTSSSTTTSSTTTTTSSSTTASSTTSSTSSSTTTPPPSSSSTLSSSSSAAPSSATSAGAGSGNSSGGSGTNLGAIIGGAVGGGVGLIVICLLLWWCVKRRRDQREADEVDYFAEHGEGAWDPAAVAGGAAAGAGAGGAAALAARQSNRMSRRRSGRGAGGAGGEDYYEEKDGNGFAVLPQKKRLLPADEQDAYYANVPLRQDSPAEGYSTGAAAAAGAAGMAGAGAASRSSHGHAYGDHQQQPYGQQLPPGAGIGPGYAPSSPPRHHQQQQSTAGNFAGVGANGRGGNGGGAYPPGMASFDPRARDGGWAAAGDSPQHQQQYPPYPAGGGNGYGYPQQSFSPPPRVDSANSLPPSIAYNPPHSSFRGPTDLAQDAQLAPPSSSRFAAYSAPDSQQPHHPGGGNGTASPTPSYRSIPALGAIPRADSTGPSEAGRQLRVVNEGEKADPYGGLDDGLRR